MKKVIGVLLILVLVSCGNVGSKEDVSKEEYQSSLQQQFQDLNKSTDYANKKMQEAEEEHQRIVQERKQAEAEALAEAKWNEIIELLQGTWEWSGNIKISSYQSQKTVAQLVVEGDYITDYSDGMVVSQGKIRDIDFDEERIYYGRDNYLEYNIDKEGYFYLYGDRDRGIRFKKLSKSALKRRENYNKHLDWWKEAYNDYMNPSPGWNSRPESLKEMHRALGYLWEDVRYGNNDQKEKVRELQRFTDRLNPY